MATAWMRIRKTRMGIRMLWAGVGVGGDGKDGRRVEIRMTWMAIKMTRIVIRMTGMNIRITGWGYK
jgi:hypothetical protein